MKKKSNKRIIRIAVCAICFIAGIFGYGKWKRRKKWCKVNADWRAGQ